MGCDPLRRGHRLAAGPLGAVGSRPPRRAVARRDTPVPLRADAGGPAERQDDPVARRSQREAAAPGRERRMTGTAARADAPRTSPYASGHVGATIPRIFTPPLRELDEDGTYGWDVIRFAEGIGWPLDPWERWAVVHLGELWHDGTPRFRFVLMLVARQNGKTTLLRDEVREKRR